MCATTASAMDRSKTIDALCAAGAQDRAPLGAATRRQLVPFAARHADLAMQSNLWRLDQLVMCAAGKTIHCRGLRPRGAASSVAAVGKHPSRHDEHRKHAARDADQLAISKRRLAAAAVKLCVVLAAGSMAAVVPNEWSQLCSVFAYDRLQISACIDGD